MERALKHLYDLFEDPRVLEDDDLRKRISDVIMRLQVIVASKVKVAERPSSPCPCGSCD